MVELDYYELIYPSKLKEYGLKNKCDICGKFRKWDDLKSVVWSVDSDYSSEDVGYECSFCLNKQEAKDAG